MSAKKKNPSLSALEAALANELQSQTTGVLPDEVKLSPPKIKKKLQLPTYPPVEVHEQLRRLAFEERTSINALTLEAWDLLFKQRGLKSIKELTAGK